MADHVFLGPSLPLPAARAILPGAGYHPPIRHGDLFRLDPVSGDRVLIVDGLFLGTAPIRHREILAVLDEGVQVWGSSSMGAMRAAELWPFGMRGVGRVFELFRDGVVTGDDEVAVVHAPAEDHHVCLSEPLVNLRVTLDASVAAGRLSRAEATALLELGRSLPFRLRGPRALAAMARPVLGTDVVDRYLAWARDRPLDVKADDARLLLAEAARTGFVPIGTAVGAGIGTAVGAGIGPGAVRWPVRNVETVHYRRWRSRHRGVSTDGLGVPDASVVAAIMSLHPQFPTLHRRHVLAQLTGTPPEAADEVERAAVALCRERGLLDPETSWAWLVPAEGGLDRQEAALRVLVRAFGTVDLATLNPETLPPSLRAAPVLAVARRFAAEALRLLESLPLPDPHRPHLRLGLRAEVVQRELARLWGCPLTSLEAAAWDRGFGDLERLHAAAGPLVARLKLRGPPSFLLAG
ncbi:TfuA-like protein [Micromonospora sp. LOL_024]|uniref:TfuA-like protein n=1 Tax=Micromonospora sp. LOL_024 TaxID=3345412 RepID=UPI003A8435DC